MNEAGLNANWLRKDLTHEETQDFAVRVLKHMRERLSDYQEQYGDLYNLEATPAESTSYRLAKHDKAQYPDIITAHEGGTPTTPIPATCLWATRRTCSPRWTCRTSSRPSTPAARCSTPSWAKSCPIGRQRRRWSVRSRRTTSCRTIRCLPPIPSAQTTLSGRGAVHLPHLRTENGGLQPHHRLLPPGAELERRQDPGVQGPEGI